MGKYLGLVIYDTEENKNYLTDKLERSEYALGDLVYLDFESIDYQFTDILSSHTDYDTVVFPSLEAMFIPKLIDNLITNDFKFIFIDFASIDCCLLSLIFKLHNFESSFGHRSTKLALQNIINSIARDGYHVSKAGNTITQLGHKKGEAYMENACIASVASKKARIANDPERKRQWLLIKDLRSRGDLMRTIADTMNATGEKAPNGGQWVQGTVSIALSNWGEYFEEKKNIKDE